MQKKTIENISLELTKEELMHIDTFFNFIIDEEYNWNDIINDEDLAEIVPVVRRFWQII